MNARALHPNAARPLHYNRPAAAAGVRLPACDDSVPVNVVERPGACDGGDEGAPLPPERQDGREGGGGCCCPQPADGREGGGAPATGGDGEGGGDEGGEGGGDGHEGGEGGGAPATGGDGEGGGDGGGAPATGGDGSGGDEGGEGGGDGHEGGDSSGAPATGGDGEGGDSSGAPATGGDGDPDRLREMLIESERRTGALEAQIRRTLADYRNLERRVNTDVDNRVRERVARFAADMVSLRDDFERAGRAVAAAGAGGGNGGSGSGGQEGGATVAAGIETVLRNMDSALSRHGVTAIDAIGEIFNPDRHEAVSAVEDADLDEGTITKELARGYALDERIIRPSQVVISKRPAAEDR